MISAHKVGELLREAGYSLQSNRKVTEGTADHPDRNAQFQWIADGCGSSGGTVFILKVIETAAANLGNPVHGIDYRLTSPANPRHDDVSVNSVRGSSGRRRHPSSLIRGFEEDLGIPLQIFSKEWVRSDVGTQTPPGL